MSKIGRKPILLNNVTVDIKGNLIHYKGQNASGVYTLGDALKAEVTDNKLLLKPAVEQKVNSRNFNRIWGMHRALLANSLNGAGAGFEKEIQINGLGYKAVQAGNKLTFSLGYSHKKELELPSDVTVKIDKTGQRLTFCSANRQKLGQVCGQVKLLRKTEPYKGTGIKLATEEIIRKAGKTKA
jgi:large subunit ribosomal protein L6